MSDKIVILGQSMGKAAVMRQAIEEARAQGIEVQVVRPDSPLVSDGNGGYGRSLISKAIPTILAAGALAAGPLFPLRGYDFGCMDKRPLQAEAQAAANLQAAREKRERRAAKRLEAGSKV